MAYKQENNPFKKIGDPPTGDVQAKTEAFG